MDMLDSVSKYGISMQKPEVRRVSIASILITAVFSVFILWSWLFPGDRTDIMPYSSRKNGGFDIVLSHYSEPPEEVKRGIQQIKAIPAIAALMPRAIVYSKGLDIISQTNNFEQLKLQLGADILRTLPNRGRESATYLNHIIDHYHDLAEHTLFAQALFDLPELAERRLATRFSPNIGVFSLNNYTTCNCEACIPIVYHGIPDLIYGFKRIPQLYVLFNERLCPPEGLLLTFKGQFVVSRKRILRNTREKYIYIRSLLDNMTHFVHDDPTEDNDMNTSITEKASDNPMFGHTLERSWMIIFGCDDVTIAQECADLDAEDDATPCGCYDM